MTLEQIVRMTGNYTTKHLWRSYPGQPDRHGISPERQIVEAGMLLNVTLPWLATLQERAPNTSDVHAEITRTQYVTTTGNIVHQERMTLWVFIRGSVCPTCPYVPPPTGTFSDDRRRLVEAQVTPPLPLTLTLTLALTLALTLT